MKATKLLVASAALAGLAALSFAGPGPEYWARKNAVSPNASHPGIARTRTPVETTVKAKPSARPAAEAATTCAPCGCCARKG